MSARRRRAAAPPPELVGEIVESPGVRVHGPPVAIAVQEKSKEAGQGAALSHPLASGDRSAAVLERWAPAARATARALAGLEDRAEAIDLAVGAAFAELADLLARRRR